MNFGEVCRICLCVNVRMYVLKKAGLRNLYKTLTNCFMDEDEPIIVCFICHARLIRCRTLQQQAIESNAALEQLLAGGSKSITKPHEAGNEIQFTPIYHIDIRPLDCNIENDCKDGIFSLESVKVEEENFENENSNFEGNHETDTAEKQEELEIDAFEDRHMNLEDDLPLIAFGSKSKADDDDIETAEKQQDLAINAFGDRHTDSENDLPLIAFESKNKEKYMTVKLKKQRRNIKKDNDDIEQHCIRTSNFSKPSEKRIKSNSADRYINVVREEYLDFEGPTIKSKSKQEKDPQPVIKKGKHPAKIMKKKILKQNSVNILTKKTSEASTRCIFECDGCRKKFLTKDILADHISHSHNTQKNSDAVQTQDEQTPVSQLMDIYYNCDICEFKTPQKRCILAHLKAHVAKQVYCCNNCDYKCTDKGNFQRHMKIHTGEKPFSCHICEYKCTRKSTLHTHMKIHTGEKPFLCNICEYNCMLKTTMRTHLKIHSGEKPFSCNICEYRCIRKSHLLRHMKIHTAEKPFSCNICEYRCITKSHLLRHMKIHTGEKEKVFSCNICEYKCILKTTMRTHIKIHTEKKPFSCHICEYRCIRKSHLLRHMKIHTGEKPFSCNICEYRCITKSHLLRHMKIHTGEKPFSCNICEYRCITKSNLQTHIMKIHIGGKPFSCKICEYRGISKRTLLRHVNIHTEAKCFS